MLLTGDPTQGCMMSSKATVASRPADDFPTLFPPGPRGTRTFVEPARFGVFGIRTFLTKFGQKQRAALWPLLVDNGNHPTQVSALCHADMRKRINHRLLELGNSLYLAHLKGVS